MILNFLEEKMVNMINVKFKKKSINLYNENIIDLIHI